MPTLHYINGSLCQTKFTANLYYFKKNIKIFFYHVVNVQTFFPKRSSKKLLTLHYIKGSLYQTKFTANLYYLKNINIL